MEKREKPNRIILASTALLLFLIIISFTVSGAAAQSTSPKEVYAYITNGGSNTVSIVDTSTNTVIATVKVESRPEGVAVSPDGTGVYVANLGSSTVSIIDTATNTVTATVGVGSNPHGVAVTPDGKKVYVTNYGSNTVSVIDTATNRVKATVNVGANPFGVAISGTKAYVTNDIDQTVSVIDTATDTVTTTMNVENQCPGGVAVAGTKIYVTSGSTNNVSVIDAKTSTVTATIPAGSNPHGVTVVGTKVYVANMDSSNVSVIDTATGNITASVNVGKGPYGVAVTPDGKKVYVANDHDNTISVIDTATNKVSATVKVANLPKAFGQFIGSIPVPVEDTNATEEAEEPPADPQENTGTEQAGSTETNTVNNYYNNTQTSYNTQTSTQTSTQTTTVNNYYSSEPAEGPENAVAEQTEDVQEEKPKASSASVNLHGEKTEVFKGEDILLKLSAVNLITKPTMHVQAIIIPPSGMSVSSTEFVESGAGQYTTTYEIEPGKGRDIEVRIAANQIGDFSVTGRVIYYFGDNKEDGEDYTLDLPIHVEDPNPQPTPELASTILQSIPGFGAASLVMVLMLVFILRRK